MTADSNDSRPEAPQESQVSHESHAPRESETGQPARVRQKPSVAELGVDLDTVEWRRSGSQPGAIEVGFVDEWVLMRVSGDPEGRVLVYDHAEWEAFLDGAKKGEFDDALTDVTA